MQFFLEMQARHEVALQKHDEAMRKHDEAIRKHDEAINRIDAALEANTTHIRQLVDVAASLASHAEETDRRMNEGFRELREILASTDFKLNALIDTVDKLVRRNGGAPQQ